MSYSSIENSNDQSRPVRLYSFQVGAATFRYTGADADVILDGYRWTAKALSDSGIVVSGDAASDTLSITAPSDISPAVLFIGTPPSQSILVRIFNYHEGDNDAVLSYVGEISQVNMSTPGSVVIACDTISLSMQRDGLRLAWQRGCPYALYDERTCKAPKAGYALPGVILDVTPGVITMTGLDAIADGWLDGGFIEWQHPQIGTEWRAIEKQVGNTLVMFGLSDGLYYGLQATAYPGCARTEDACTTKFNNLDNFGGIGEQMPGRSPFDGNPVF